MSDNPKEAEKQMEKAIFISADCWLSVFDLLPPFQLGLGIAMISRRFDYFVDEHFKTRKWTLQNKIRIRGVFGKNFEREMEIVNSDREALPIPQIPLPNKVIGFGRIMIEYIDQNVFTFLHRFDRLFATFEKKLHIDTSTEDFRAPEIILRKIWPLFNDTIRLVTFNATAFHYMHQLAPSILIGCPALRVVGFDGTILPEFPPDDSANASVGQAVAKWLFSPRPDKLMKVLVIKNTSAVRRWEATVEQIKAAFSSASSPVPFIILINFRSSSSLFSIEPFELTNQLTGEELVLSKDNEKRVLLIRCPIAAMDWEEEFMKAVGRNNKIGIFIGYYGFDHLWPLRTPGRVVFNRGMKCD